MPIYEFACDNCRTLFSFFSRSVDTTTRPICPRCNKVRLQRRPSLFAVGGRHAEDEDADLPIDEQRLQRAVEAMESQAQGLDEDDPRQAARLMRSFSEMAGMELGPAMNEALERMQRGEDPEQIEQELGDRLEEEDPFVLSAAKTRAGRGPQRRRAWKRDETLYDLHPQAG